jgi:hypothetical protein
VAGRIARSPLAEPTRATRRWSYHWNRDGNPGHVQDADVFGVRDGRVAEKLSYVKG